MSSSAGCRGCKWWSEMLAQSIGGGPLEAYCYKKESPHYNGYAHQGCAWKEEGVAVDDPSLNAPDEEFEIDGMPPWAHG